ncbi:speckle targeted PIP5K1A-regulated poly(A) polymerase [Patella vulgata]|uniref:speckle targeted PIP5K1A-regulated poly(A) polymerase n=1 Tax=Patella vulgata TaxID=6465 RepID=UPI00217F4F5A|nr:speckle targeted PIP5K1A-regulated poly(A) polymerase [Patella vulgata]XP_050405950.1 speckle targeted PIP5K1A-regulated poly(A) polymerase [Patella vulgata]
MVVYCEICQTSVPSDAAMLQHLKGKKHIKNAKTVDLRDRQIRCSVFVRGFPPCAREFDIQNYFSEYGKILSFYFDSNRKHFAIIEYEHVESAQQVIKGRHHSLNGYTMVAKERENKPVHNKPMASTSQIRSKPNTKPNKKKKLLAKCTREEETVEKGDSAIIHMFKNAKSINEQMAMLKDSMALTEEDFKQRNSICKMLLEVLKPYFPESTLHQFGSSVNGFGVKGCDLDLFLDFNDDKQESKQKQHTPVQLPYVRDITTLKKSCGPLYSHDLQQMSLYDKVKLVSRILCEKGPGCNDIFCIPSTRCPVVRFVHEPSGLKCDLSVNNRLALRNTQLLALYSSLDERVKLLVFTIRYWAKLRKIAGNENAGPRLTNYALTLLVVYYLQNTSPPVLPSVKTLAELSDSTTMIDGWDCSFVKDINLIPETQNTTSEAQLLEKFFQFYSQTEFSAAVLQCQYGKPKLLTAFAEEMSQSSQLINFKFGPISVQDPFVLEHNITLNVNEKTKHKIVDQFRISSLMSCNWSSDDQSKLVQDDQWGLMMLLSEELPHEFTESHQSEHEDIRCDDVYSFPIVFKMSMLSEIAFKQLQTKGDYRYHWCLHVCSFLQKLLSHILLINVQLEYTSLKSTDEFAKPISDSIDEKSQNEMPPSSTDCDISDSVSENYCNEKTLDDTEELNCEASAKYVAGLIIDVNRSKRLSSDSLNNESESKRCRTCLDADINDVPAEDENSSLLEIKDLEHSPDSCKGENGSTDSSANGNHQENMESSVAVDAIMDSETSSRSNLTDHVVEATNNDFGTLIWMCTSECATFNGRKTVRKETLLEGFPENLDLEREVSKRILEKSEKIKFKLGFRCVLKPLVESGSTAVLLHFEPVENKKQFSCFYQFLKTFVIKMVDRYLFS